MIRGQYGEYKVLVDDAVVVDGGPLVILGVMPSSRKIVDIVRDRVLGTRLTNEQEGGP